MQAVNQKLLSQFPLGQLERVEVVLEQVETDQQTVIEQSQLDQMWSYVGKKTNQRWLWHTIELKTGRILADVFGQRKDEVLLKLKKLLKPFGIKKYCTDGWGTYERHLPVDKHEISKRKTQKIERHLGLRRTIKRLARKTSCFSKSEQMHDLVIGLLINRYEFGLLI